MALAEGPRPLSDLRRETGSPPQTTMRGYLKALAEMGVVDKRRRDDFPGNIEYRLTEGGRELLAVAQILAAWLKAFPDGSTGLGSGGAKSAITALVEGWSTSIVRALAVRPLSLTELDSVIASVSYPSLERRISAMRLASLVEPTSSTGRGRPLAVTDWLRKAIGPIAAAARWERRRLREKAPAITNRDAESAFLLALPLLNVPPDLSGSCRLGVQVVGAKGLTLAGVVVSVRAGAIEICGTRLEADVDAWAIGSAGAWFASVIDRDTGFLEMGGDSRIAADLIEGLHGMLFGSTARS